MKTPLVSIIIPIYNQDKYIPQAIESAISQDYDNLEVIVSDDNSKENTTKLIQKYKKNRKFRYFRNKKNLGRVRNYNKALYDYAKGDFALILDGDDYLIDKSYITQAIELIKKNDLIMVFAKQKVLIESRNLVIEDKMNDHLPKIINGNLLFLTYPKGFSIPHLSTIYNRKYAMKIGYYEKDILSSDWESMLRLIINNKIGFIKKNVGIWRKHSFNASKSVRMEDIMRNTQYIESPYKYCLKNSFFSKPILNSWRVRMLKRYFIKDLIKLIIVNNRELYKKLLLEIRNYDEGVYSSIKFDLRFMLIKPILRNKTMTKFIFKNIIENESFLEDLQ